MSRTGDGVEGGRRHHPVLTAQAVRGVLRHPSLWVTAIVQAFRLAPPGWWRRRPFLPLPDPDYVRFRLQTAYGDPDREPAPEDLLTYLHWCRHFPD